jgi:hypothetical protein
LRLSISDNTLVPGAPSASWSQSQRTAKCAQQGMARGGWPNSDRSLSGIPA